MKNLYRVLFLLVWFGSYIQAHIFDDVLIQMRKRYEDISELVKRNDFDQSSLCATLSGLDFDPELYFVRLKNDMQCLKCLKKQYKKQRFIHELHSFYQELKSIDKFLKKHRVVWDALVVHASFYRLWQRAIDILDEKKDITDCFSVYGFSSTNSGIRMFVSTIDKWVKKMELIEYRLHADWIDLKLANYVARIQTIRLRNAGIFHRLYQGVEFPTTYPR